MIGGVEFRKVTVIGAGTMGAGIAQVCAQAGSQVALCDISQAVLAKGMATIAKFMDRAVEKGKFTHEVGEAIKDQIQTSTDRSAVVSDADLIVEAVPEKLALKQEVFKEISAACPAGAVLASNTSSLALSEIFAEVAQPERCIGTHFFNPVPVMALLEVVRTEQTAQPVIDRVLAYAQQLNKEPILVKDSPGFATSRLGVCLGLEAIRMVEAGVASPEAIDKAMELGYRHPMGPLKLTDLVGLDVRMAIADYLRQELASPVFEVPELMRSMVKAGKLGKKAGQGFYAW
ncbi:MAG: 3-hydroxyacyl-CoA dehydrogenase family protein [Planctomycetota bacterium]|jgi:3-hydroxybutyryl-CoA dehydrogenase